MQDVERLLTAASVTVRSVDPAHADARAGIRAYVAELDRGFRRGSIPERGSPPSRMSCDRPPVSSSSPISGVSRSAAAPSSTTGPRAGRRSSGSGWPMPYAGSGSAGACSASSKAGPWPPGSRVVRLDTHRSLTEAAALYRSAGYREVAAYNDNPYAHHWFAKNL